MGHGYTLQPTENGIKKGKNNLTHNMLINIIISFTIFDKSSIIRVGTKKRTPSVRALKVQKMLQVSKGYQPTSKLVLFSNNLLLS